MHVRSFNLISRALISDPLSQSLLVQVPGQVSLYPSVLLVIEIIKMNIDIPEAAGIRSSWTISLILVNAYWHAVLQKNGLMDPSLRSAPYCDFVMLIRERETDL